MEGQPFNHPWGWRGSFRPPKAAGIKGPHHGMGWARDQGNERGGLAQPAGSFPVSFLGFIHFFWVSPPAVLPLSHAAHPCPLWDPISKGLSGRPKEVLGGHMLADPGLLNETSPSTPTTKVKGLWAYGIPLKLDVSSQPSQCLNQNEIHGWPRW